MAQKKSWSTMSGILAVLAIFLVPPGAAAGSTSKVLYKFKGGNDGGHPVAGLIFDPAGNLYGTTAAGGQTCNGNQPCGTVFRLTPESGGKWTERVLYRFAGGRDGYGPWGGLIFDGAGNLYGSTTVSSTIFKLMPNSDGTWTENVLYRFSGPDGGDPLASLIFDATGNLYGTTADGGASDAGTVFKLTPNSDGTWTESVLHSFSGPDGGTPYAGLIFDAAGNLYGTTSSGGAGGGGVVFELTPNSHGSWKEHVLHAFKG